MILPPDFFGGLILLVDGLGSSCLFWGFGFSCLIGAFVVFKPEHSWSSGIRCLCWIIVFSRYLRQTSVLQDVHLCEFISVNFVPQPLTEQSFLESGLVDLDLQSDFWCFSNYSFNKSGNSLTHSFSFWVPASYLIVLLQSGHIITLISPALAFAQLCLLGSRWVWQN